MKYHTTEVKTVDWVNRYFKKNQDNITELALELIRLQPTYVDDGTGIAAAQETVSSALTALSSTVTREFPPSNVIKAHPDYVDVSSYSDTFDNYEPGRSPHVIGRWEGSGAATLALAGHIDVEPVFEERWTNVADAQGTIREGRLIGRGAADMLGGLAAMVISAGAAAQHGLKTNLELHSVPDEELGGNGTLGLLAAHDPPDYAIIGEPTDGAVCEATLGFQHFKITVTGDSRHAAAVQSNFTALHDLGPVMQCLDSVRDDLAQRIRMCASFSDYSGNALTLGRVRGGNDPAVPPTKVVLEGVVFMPPDMTPGDVAVLLRQALHDRRGALSRQVSLTRMGFSGNAPNASSRFVQTALQAGKSMAIDVPRRGFPSPCDLRLYTRREVQGVVWGPGNLADAHAPNESVAVLELVNYARTLTLFLLTFDGSCSND